jgi:tetraacyldisaccharide 4'-kinase
MCADNLFGYSHYLPRGYLRESPKKLKEAQFICITQVEGHSFDKLCEQIAPYTSAKIIGAQMVPQKIVGDKNWDLDQIKGKKVGVFCGIGQPAAYMRSLEQLGAEIVATLVVNDHSTATSKEWERFIEACLQKHVELLLCTEKDFVKIHNIKREIPISYVESRLRILHGSKYYRALKQKILQLAKHKRVTI